MKKLLALALMLVCVFALIGCNDSKKGASQDDVTDSFTFVVMEVTENNLLVAEIGEDGKAIETQQYSVPNWFNPNTEIKEGYKITIKYNGGILETYPMQFAEITSMEYWDRETGLCTTVIAD